MYEILLVVYLLVSLALIGLVMIQQGKGADMGASFGAGASNTVFGSGGSGSFLTRTTAILATLFFLISLVLGSMSSNKVKQGSEWENLQQTQQVEQTKAPVKKLTSDAYLQKRAAEVNAEKISVTENVKPGLEPAHTTHFSILDKDGNAVANTYTLNWDYGNGVVVEGAGFLLNDEMDDFSAKAGAANIFGVVGSDANAIEPGKRMLSSMSPTIMTNDGRVNLIIGTPGGSRIFTSIFQVINNLYDYNLPLQQAVNAQRFHHQLLPKDVIYYDDFAPITGEVAAQLKLMGYTVEDQGWRLGDIQAIQVKDGKVSAASDARGRGHNAVLQP